MQRLLMIGMNHATAPVAVRERFAFSGTQREIALRRFKEAFPETEAVLVSTCNRVELYASRPVHGHPRIEEMVSFLANFHQFSEQQLKPYLYERSNRAVAEHLFTVAGSLDSIVVGETQILGQIREAYEVSAKLGMADALLHPLFQRALAAAREVMRATGLAEGRRSIASIAVEYARQIFEDFRDKTVLSIGAGKMSTLVLQHFSELHPKEMVICNRNVEKAEDLAKRFGGRCVSMDSMMQHLAEADVIISSTASPSPIITGTMFQQVMKLRRWRPVFLVDIALPRDIDPAVGDLDNVYLYNIDDLQEVAAATDSTRREAVERARELMVKQVDDFVAWHSAREIGPLIEQLFSKSHAMAKDEVQRTVNKLPDMTADQREQVEELARRIVNKLLNDPVQAVRSPDGAPSARALARLFRLQPPKGEKD